MRRMKQPMLVSWTRHFASSAHKRPGGAPRLRDVLVQSLTRLYRLLEVHRAHRDLANERHCLLLACGRREDVYLDAHQIIGREGLRGLLDIRTGNDREKGSTHTTGAVAQNVDRVLTGQAARGGNCGQVEAFQRYRSHDRGTMSDEMDEKLGGEKSSSETHRQKQKQKQEKEQWPLNGRTAALLTLRVQRQWRQMTTKLASERWQLDGTGSERVFTEWRMSRERARVSPACRTTPHWQLRWHDRALLPWVADCAAALIAGPRRGGRLTAYSRLEERREARVHYRRSHVHRQRLRVFWVSGSPSGLWTGAHLWDRTLVDVDGESALIGIGRALTGRKSSGPRTLAISRRPALFYVHTVESRPLQRLQLSACYDSGSPGGAVILWALWARRIVAMAAERTHGRQLGLVGVTPARVGHEKAGRCDVRKTLGGERGWTDERGWRAGRWAKRALNRGGGGGRRRACEADGCGREPHFGGCCGYTARQTGEKEEVEAAERRGWIWKTRRSGPHSSCRTWPNVSRGCAPPAQAQNEEASSRSSVADADDGEREKAIASRSYTSKCQAVRERGRHACFLSRFVSE
ncbi:hypothetical protein C8Q73DRAFT_780257 [Cubamyces lactineus]|nr:hypothetical protein C8Q73DRAFT_780257 [Cubamyces lactineus]